jgi:hypothetical protein
MSRSRREAHKHNGQRRRPGTYTAIHNDVLTDPTLSLAAFRVLMYLATKPDGWTVQTADIANELGLPYQTVRQVVRPELTKAGYLKTAKIRKDGRIVASETTLVRPLVVYFGKTAGRLQSTEIPDPGESPVWIDDIEQPQSGVVSPGHHRSPLIPDSGESRHLVSTDIVVTTDSKEVVTTNKIVTTEHKTVRNPDYNHCPKHGLYALTLRACPSCPVDENDPMLQRLRSMRPSPTDYQDQPASRAW